MSIKPIHFVVHAQLFCGSCGSRLAIIRRAPQPSGAADGEMHTFSCTGCGGQMQRYVDCSGAAMPGEALLQH